MTDNEIIKALERCSSKETDACVGCPFMDLPDYECTIESARSVVAIINRQKAEIERLVEHTKEGIDLAKQLPETLKLAQAEAIQEFAERLESKLANNTDISAVGYQSVIGEIDNLVKEMVGDDNENV